MSRTAFLMLGWFALWATLPPIAFAEGPIATGPFLAGDPWFLVPPGLSGVQKPVIGETVIHIDQDGDGFPNGPGDATFDLPPEIRPDNINPRRFDFEHNLSPTQDMLYVKKLGDNGFNVCGAPNLVQIYLYLLTSPPNLAPFTGDQAACVPSPISIQPRFFGHDGDVIRTMYLVGAPFPAATPTHQSILWADLINGVSNLDSSSYGHGVLNFPQFAPSGNAAFVIHSNNTSPKYTFVDLCKSRVGGALGVTSARDLGAPVVTAHVLDAGDEFHAIIRRNGNDVVGSNVLLDVSCFKPPTPRACCFPEGFCFDYFPDFCASAGGTPDPQGRLCADVICEDTTTEACCFPDGSCAVLLEADCTAQGGAPQTGYPTCDSAFCPPPQEACCYLQGFCQDTDVENCAVGGGTSQGTGTDCASTVCRELVLEVSASGPAAAELGEVFTYTLAYANTGALDGMGVVLTAYLASSTDFVSASHGGTQPGLGIVEWDLGDLAAGASGQVTLTVRADCSGFPGDTYFSGYFLEDSRGVFVNGAVEVITTLSAPTLGALGLQVVSTPAASLPLKPADTVTHTVTLTNLAAHRQSGLTFEFRAGSDATLTSVIDPGSGVVDMTSPNRWVWTGALDPLDDTTVSFRTRMGDCLTVTRTALNGGVIVVTHTCGDELARATTQTLPVRPVINVAMETTNFPPASRLVSFITDRLVQLVRFNQPIDFRLTFGNNTPNPIPAVNASIPLSSNLLPAGNPPFIAPTDPGATYNAGSRTINWSGPLAAGQTVVISFRASLIFGACMVLQSSVVGDGTCNYPFELWLEGVPEPPSEPHLVLISSSGNVWTFRPGLDSAVQLMFCSAAEFLTSLDVADNGDIWIAGAPTFRFNPATLAIEGFPLRFFGDLGVPVPNGVASDSADGTVIFTGTSYANNETSAVARRYDPVTRTITPIIDDPDLDGLVLPLVDPDGRLAAIPAAPPVRAVVRIDPANPANYQSFDTTNYGSPTCLTLDTDGNYVAAFVSPAPATPLAKIERNSGTFSGIVGNLQSLTGFPGGFNACAVGDNGDVFLTTPHAALYAVRRTGPPSAQVLAPPTGGFGQDMAWGVPSSGLGDINLDGRINLRDFAEYANCFSLNTVLVPDCACADLHTDGVIDLDDLPPMVQNLGAYTSVRPPGCP